MSERDLTHQHAAMTAAEAAAAQFPTEMTTVLEPIPAWVHTVISNVPDALIIKTPDGRWMEANSAARRLFDLEDVEYNGKTEAELGQLVPFYREALLVCQRTDDHAWQSGRSMQTEEVVHRHDGSSSIFEVIKVPLFNPDGSRQALVVVARDVTRHREAEGAITVSENRLRALVRNSPYGIYRSDLGGRLLDANPAFAHMLGYDSETEIVGCDLASDLYVDASERQRLLKEWEEDDPERPLETRWRKKDGSTIHVRVRCRVVRSRDGSIRGFEGFAEDVTEQRRLEEQLRQAQKMEAIGQLAGGVAHDFNNLLTLMLGNTGILLKNLATSDPLHRNATEVMKAAERARELTRQLLAFSRKQVLAPKVLDVNDVLAEISGMLPRLLGEDIELEVLPAAVPAMVKADPTQLQQVIMNLASNARDAMPQGGTLTIRAGIIDLKRENDCYEASFQAGSYVTLEIADSGCGISKEVQNHIFEPFFTTKEAGKGTGLGLATVYGIVDQSGGHITVHSDLGSGTTFKIYLPQTRETAEVEPIDKFLRPAAEIPTGTETILLVEDEDGIRSMMRVFLEQRGYKLLDAKTGAEAMTLSEEYPDRIHLLVSDIIMPGMRGTELATRLLLTREDMTVLLISGYSPVNIDQQAMYLLEKPFSMEDFARKVRHILDIEAHSAHRTAASA